MDEFSVTDILMGLDTDYVGQNPVVLAQTGSTNSEARRLAETGAPEGTLVIADYQTAGRGRLDRRWEAPPGSSLLMSLVFRPALDPAQAPLLTMVCSLAMLDAVELETGLCANLKWPNDIVLRDAKLGGILAETGVAGGRLEYVVVGMGLNVNLDPARLGELLMPAISLSSALGTRVDRLLLLCAVLRVVEERYERLRAGISPRDEYVERLVTVGQQVTVTCSDGRYEGEAEGIDETGALSVRLGSGGLQTIMAGDVTLRV